MFKSVMDFVDFETKKSTKDSPERLITPDVIDKYLKTGDLRIVEKALERTVVLYDDQDLAPKPKNKTKIPERSIYEHEILGSAPVRTDAVNKKIVLAAITPKEKEIRSIFYKMRQKRKISNLLSLYAKGLIGENSMRYEEAKNLFECRHLYLRYVNDRTFKWTLSYVDRGKLNRWIDWYDPAHSMQSYVDQISGIVASMRGDEFYWGTKSEKDYPYEKRVSDQKDVLRKIANLGHMAMTRLDARKIGIDDGFVFPTVSKYIGGYLMKLYHFKYANVTIERNQNNKSMFNCAVETNRGRFITVF